MALNTNRYYPNAAPVIKGQILNATGTEAVTLITGGAVNGNWSVVETLGASSTDTVARVIQLYITVSAVDYNICAVNIPAEAGTKSDASVPAVDLLRSSNWPWLAYDAFGNRIALLTNGAALKVMVKATLTAAKQIDFLGHATEY